MGSKKTREEKPHAHFGDPQDVVDDPALSKEEKVEALETLEQDARLQATAAQEGMTGGEENKLQEVLDAKKALEERDGAPNPADNPPAGSDAEVAKEAEIEKLDP